ncbi:MAG: tetratricopeptide repeat protein, partial [Candidatus Thermoplasmatota archaeon]
MEQKKDKRFTDDFVEKWSRSSKPPKKEDKTEEVLRKQDALLKKDPKNAKVWYARALILADLGRYSQALTCLNKAEEFDPTLEGLFTAKGNVLSRLDRYSEAALYFKKGLEAKARAVAPALGEQIGEIKGAEEILREIVAELGGTVEEMVGEEDAISDLMSLKGIGRLKAQALFDAGFRSLKELKEATLEELQQVPGIGTKSAAAILSAFAEEAVGAPSEEERPCPLCGTILSAADKECFECGVTFEERPDALERRLEAIEERIKADPQDLAARFEKGEILAEMGKTREAISALNEVTKSDPSYPDVWDLKAALFTQLGEEKIAASCYKRAVEEREKRKKTVDAAALLGELEEIVKEAPKDEWLAEQRRMKEELARLAEEEIGLPRAPALPTKEEEERIEQITREIVPEIKAPPEEEKLERVTPSPAEIKKPRAPGLTNGLTNGLLRGRTNGLTNGVRGRTNGLVNGIRGRTNGLTNGVRGRTNGLVNGIRGRTNGLTNGVRGRTNGLVNGIRGRTNGLVNGVRGRTNGLVNGVRGRTNGLTNGVRGRTNGLTNGVKAGITTPGLVNGLGVIDFGAFGMTNGLTNGFGLTNGLGGYRFARGARLARWKLYVIPLVLFALIVVPLFSSIVPTVVEAALPISIDGRFADWSSAAMHPSSRDSIQLSPNIDIVSTATEDNGGRYLAIYVEVAGAILSGEPVETNGLVDKVRIFIDGDGARSTGYEIEGMGAEHMIEISGWRQGISSAALFRHGGDGWDWNCFSTQSSVSARLSGSKLETQVDWSVLGNASAPRVLVSTQSWEGGYDCADFVTSSGRGALRVVQESVGDVVSGANARLTRLEVVAGHGGASINGLRMQLNGSAASPSLIRLVRS